MAFPPFAIPPAIRSGAMPSNAPSTIKLLTSMVPSGSNSSRSAISSAIGP
jgi:hypothetical protein